MAPATQEIPTFRSTEITPQGGDKKNMFPVLGLFWRFFVSGVGGTDSWDLFHPQRTCPEVGEGEGGKLKAAPNHHSLVAPRGGWRIFFIYEDLSMRTCENITLSLQKNNINVAKSLGKLVPFHFHCASCRYVHVGLFHN